MEAHEETERVKSKAGKLEIEQVKAEAEIGKIKDIAEHLDYEKHKLLEKAAIRMDGLVRVLRSFNSTSVISRR